jgi:hypothetical protein
MAISVVLVPPSRASSPSSFSTDMDTFLAALPVFTTQVNSTETNINSQAAAALASQTAAAGSVVTAAGSATTATVQVSLATAQVVIATAQASAAAASALSATNSPGTSSTSTSTLLMGVGVQTFTTQTGKGWVVGQPVNMVQTSNPTVNTMYGLISAYNSSTGTMSVTIAVAADIAGSGTYSDWTIALTGPKGNPVVGVTRGKIYFTGA